MSDPEEREALRRARQIDELEELPEDPRATRDRAELQRWKDFAASPWIQPPTVADAVAQAKDKRAIGLLEAVDMMAFGTEKPPRDVIEVGARRVQACRALCDGAHAEAFSLWGRLGKTSDKLEPIPPEDFGTSRRIGDGSNVLELDASSVPSEDEARFDRLHIGKWFDVQIGKKERFLVWLAGAPTDRIGETHQKPLSEQTSKSAGVPEPAITSVDGRPRRSRKKQGSYGPLDEPLLEEMERLILARNVASPQAAATEVADRAHGNSIFDSKVRRLARSYLKSGRPTSA